MRWQVSPLVLVLAAAAIFGACADTHQPVGPASDSPLVVAASPESLPRWHARSSPAVMGLPGIVFADHDEANNRLVYGVEHPAAGPAVENALERMGIPASAYTIQTVEPVHFAATLREKVRATQGGLQIHFGGFLCTLGFNASDGTQRSFVTNSHCTNTQGGVESTTYYQPLSSIDPTVIATEVEDPAYFTGGACPAGRRCRYSDSARALYNTAVTSTRGKIAKTSAANNGSLSVTGSFTITTQDIATTSFAIGTTVNKVGRTTGWTQGNVTRTCVDTNVSNSDITLLCQTFVANPGGAVVVGGGDSGSQVFRITKSTNVQLVGILWGSNSSGTEFIFSPFKQVRDELGALTATK